MSEFILEWVDDKIVSPFDLDFTGEVTLTSICKYLQEAAGNHAHHLNLGITHLGNENKVWVLSRLLIKIISLPKLGEKISVHTWPASIERLFARRDYEIKNANNESLVKASSYFLVIDAVRRRPVRPDYFREKVKDFPEKFSLDEKPSDIPDIIEAGIPNEKKILYSDIDLLKHANNVKYTEWILDSYPVEFIEKNKIGFYEIHFLAELLYDDDIIIKSEKDAEYKFHHCIIRKSDGKTASKARIEWESK
jgi:medium-chain acyl-[acyl-carrier-protein] hydrolase